MAVVETVTNRAMSTKLGGGGRLRAGWLLGSLALLGAAMVIVIAVARLSSPAPTPLVDDSSRAASMYSTDELAVMRLVAKGYIPAGTLHSEQFITKNLFNQGLLPRETLRVNVVPGPSLYSAQERGVMAAVAKGLVPSEALERDTFLIKRHINQGLIPREAANLPSREAGR
jgi:hypothetical protein